MMMGFGFLGLLLMFLFWGGIIAGAVFLISAIFPRGKEPLPRLAREKLSARQTLDQRYARGEITREEFEIVRQDIEE